MRLATLFENYLQNMKKIEKFRAQVKEGNVAPGSIEGWQIGYFPSKVGQTKISNLSKPTKTQTAKIPSVSK